MFLVNTADKVFWKTDEPILFLGEWCNPVDLQVLAPNLNYKTLPYHWGDQKKIHKDYQ